MVVNRPVPSGIKAVSGFLLLQVSPKPPPETGFLGLGGGGLVGLGGGELAICLTGGLAIAVDDMDSRTPIARLTRP